MLGSCPPLTPHDVAFWFNEQVWIEFVKGIFLIFGLVVGGLLVNRGLEKYKTDQAVGAELRKRQYDELADMLKKLGVEEYQRTVEDLRAPLTALLPRPPGLDLTAKP